MAAGFPSATAGEHEAELSTEDGLELSPESEPGMGDAAVERLKGDEYPDDEPEE